MTISYSDTFVRLLLRWDGSLWKSIWRRLFVYLALYYTIHTIYRFCLNRDQQEVFLSIAKFCNESLAYIPLEFVLGFFVSSILARWWSQCHCISCPETVMILVTTYIQGDQYLMLRRTIARWLNLSSVLGWRTICSRTLRRFPTEEHAVLAGLMTREEFEAYKKISGPHGKWFVPLQWLNNLMNRCFQDKIIDSVQLNCIIKEIYKFRNDTVLGVKTLKTFEWITIPLAYTQVVTIATYGYFFMTLFSQQITGTTKKAHLEFWPPVFTILQFLFYMGWFKVGEDLINPLGNDDDDFELNYVLDKNFHTAFLLADQLNGQLPCLEKDLFWGRPNPTLPHTKASWQHKDNAFSGHLSTMKIKQDQQQLVGGVETFSQTKHVDCLATRSFEAVLKRARKITGANGKIHDASAK